MLESSTAEVQDVLEAPAALHATVTEVVELLQALKIDKTAERQPVSNKRIERSPARTAKL